MGSQRRSKKEDSLLTHPLTPKLEGLPICEPLFRIHHRLENHKMPKKAKRGKVSFTDSFSSQKSSRILYNDKPRTWEAEGEVGSQLTGDARIEAHLPGPEHRVL